LIPAASGTERQTNALRQYDNDASISEARVGIIDFGFSGDDTLTHRNDSNRKPMFEFLIDIVIKSASTVAILLAYLNAPCS